MSGSGFGICGHLNSYNAGVRQGNWVEDLIGQDIASVRGRGQTNEFQTESKANYTHPAEMKQGAEDSKASANQDSRSGLPGRLLFNHGPNMLHVDEVPKTDAGKERLRKREARLEEEKSQVAHRHTEYQSMNKLADDVQFKVRGPSEPVKMPVFTRNSTFSRGELLDL